MQQTDARVLTAVGDVVIEKDRTGLNEDDVFSKTDPLGIDRESCDRALQFLMESGYATGRRTPDGRWGLLQLTGLGLEQYARHDVPEYEQLKRKIVRSLQDQLDSTSGHIRDARADTVKQEVECPSVLLNHILEQWNMQGLIEARGPFAGGDWSISSLSETLRRWTHNESSQR